MAETSPPVESNETYKIQLCKLVQHLVDERHVIGIDITGGNYMSTDLKDQYLKELAITKKALSPQQIIPKEIARVIRRPINAAIHGARRVLQNLAITASSSVDDPLFDLTTARDSTSYRSAHINNQNAVREELTHTQLHILFGAKTIDLSEIKVNYLQNGIDSYPSRDTFYFHEADNREPRNASLGSLSDMSYLLASFRNVDDFITQDEPTIQTSTELFERIQSSISAMMISSQGSPEVQFTTKDTLLSFTHIGLPSFSMENMSRGFMKNARDIGKNIELMNKSLI